MYRYRLLARLLLGCCLLAQRDGGDDGLLVRRRHQRHAERQRARSADQGCAAAWLGRRQREADGDCGAERQHIWCLSGGLEKKKIEEKIVVVDDSASGIDLASPHTHSIVFGNFD